MALVKQYQTKVNDFYYSPSVDYETWAKFDEICWEKLNNVSEPSHLKDIAVDCATITSPSDKQYWADWVARVNQFLQDYFPDDDDSTSSASFEDVQYGFIKIFQCEPDHAAHNNDLWAAFNEAAVEMVSARG